MAVDKTPRQNRVREALGRIYEHQPPYFREYLRRFKEDPTSRVFAPLAEAYRRLGRVDEGIEICLEGLVHHPDFHGGRLALAKCYIDKRMFREARAELERVVRSVPENLLGQRLLGDVCSALGDRPQALHCYKMALLLSPADVVLSEKVHAFERSLPASEVAAFKPTPIPQPIAPAPATPSQQLSPSIPPLWTPEESDPEPSSLWHVDAIEPAEPPRLPQRAVDAVEGPKQPPTGPEDFDLEEPIFPAPPPAEDLDVNQQDSSRISRLLGVGEDESDEEAFKVQHVSAIFGEPEVAPREITTETLGDLYFSQGQFERSLRIFEKLQLQHPSTELTKKIVACRERLDVTPEDQTRDKKIETLRTILQQMKRHKA